MRSILYVGRRLVVTGFGSSTAPLAPLLPDADALRATSANVGGGFVYDHVKVEEPSCDPSAAALLTSGVLERERRRGGLSLGLCRVLILDTASRGAEERERDMNRFLAPNTVLLRRMNFLKRILMFEGSGSASYSYMKNAVSGVVIIN